MITSADYWAFRLLNDFAGSNAWLDRAMLLLARYGPVFFIGALPWLWLRPVGEPAKFRDRLAVGRALAAAALALGLGQLIGLVLPRLRPFQGHSVRLLIVPNFDPSFPSDHALAAFAITTALAATHPRLSLGLLPLATLLGVARVFVGIHYPLDILGGAILGGAIGGLIHKADVWLVPMIRYADAVWEKIGTPGTRQ